MTKQEQTAKSQPAGGSFLGVPNMLYTLDMYGEPLPFFNMGGQTKVRTAFGGIISLVIFSMLFMFGMLKFKQLMSKHNPSVNFFIERDAIDENDVWYADDD